MPETITDERKYRHRWLALIGLSMALVILNLDLTIVSLALPILGHQFHAKLSTLQWISNIYSLTFAALVMLTGKLADQHGYRLVYLWGIICFFIGSLIAGLAPNLMIIILGRLFQGVGMAGTFGMVFILANRAFPQIQRKLAIGLLVTFTGIAQAIGPTIGGFIIEHWSWRWAFLINLPFCIFSFVLVILTCQADKLKKKLIIHYPSAILLMITYVVLVFIFNKTQDFSAHVFALIVITMGSIIIFSGVFFWQRRLAEPFLDLKLFRNKIYFALGIIRPIFQFNFGAFFFVIPLYLQNAIGLSPTNTGLILLIMTVALAISSASIGRLSNSISIGSSIIFAHILSIIGFAIFAITPIAPIHWLLLSTALVCIGINVGIIFAVTNHAAINSLPLEHRGIGFGFFTANAFFFYSIGIAVAGHLLSSIGFSHFNALVSAKFNQHSHLFNNETFRPYVNGARPIQALTNIYPEHGQVLKTLALKAFSEGFHFVMWLFSSLSLLGLICSVWFLKLKYKSNR
jgi:EmrB/QacA subfamily drug resistance transporter